MASVSRFVDLQCWQLATEFKRSVYALLDRPKVRRDIRFCEQFRDAAASAPRNIAEGFGRKTNRDFAHFLDVARASLAECQNHLIDAVDRGYLLEAESKELNLMAVRASAAIAALQRYLRARASSLPKPTRRS